MGDVFDRVAAMPVMADLWPRQAGDGSEFASDPELAAVSTYTVARILLAESMRRLLTAARIAKDPGPARNGDHLVLLRPALVSTAKAMWLVAATNSVERASRAARLVIADRQQGARAMQKATAQGAPAGFGAVGSAFERSRVVARSVVHGLTADSHKPSPDDQTLIIELGSEIDRYYGTSDAVSDVQLLWSTSSSLVHGERWYSTLFGGSRREAVAEILTVRSFDVVCSGLNVASLRVVGLAATRA